MAFIHFIYVNKKFNYRCQPVEQTTTTHYCIETQFLKVGGGGKCPAPQGGSMCWCVTLHYIKIINVA